MIPKMQRRIGIVYKDKSSNTIIFNADIDTVIKLKFLGNIVFNSKYQYHMTVDSRYDFGDVLTYIDELNDELKSAPIAQ